MKVLVSAYACEPGRGSEPGAGWHWAAAAAADHEVWVLTHGTNREPVTRALEADPELARTLHVRFVSNPAWLRWLRRGPGRFLYYVLWQVGVCRTQARRLHREVGFQVTHHVTYAADWLPAGAAVPSVPFVWGPVGGASTIGTPGVWRRLGARGFAAAAARAALLVPLRRLVGGWTAARAAVVLGQNRDVVRAFRPVAVRLEPNVVAREVTVPQAGAPDAPRAVYVGRLVAWKGLRLVLDALRRRDCAAWSLDVYGTGPELRRLRRSAVRWGLSDRVRWHGQRPHDEVLAAMAAADALVLPSVHDAAGWVVAEARSVGCPVVCLDLGGPADLLGADGGIAVATDGDVVAGLAHALRAVVGRRRVVDSRWAAARLPVLVSAVYSEAVDGASARGTEMSWSTR